uniref:Uncharacterized protein n=1 Tax=Oryza punctata TaxID=4537 RepID=A0A0E0LJ21_ORYPU
MPSLWLLLAPTDGGGGLLNTLIKLYNLWRTVHLVTTSKVENQVVAVAAVGHRVFREAGVEEEAYPVVVVAVEEVAEELLVLSSQSLGDKKGPELLTPPPYLCTLAFSAFSFIAFSRSVARYLSSAKPPTVFDISWNEDATFTSSMTSPGSCSLFPNVVMPMPSPAFLSMRASRGPFGFWLALSLFGEPLSRSTALEFEGAGPAQAPLRRHRRSGPQDGGASARRRERVVARAERGSRQMGVPSRHSMAAAAAAAEGGRGTAACACACGGAGMM